MLVNVIEEGNFVVADLDETQTEKFMDMLRGHGFDVEYDEDWNEVNFSQERISDLDQLRTDLNRMFDKVTSEESLVVDITSVRLEKERREFYGEIQMVYCLYSEGEIHSKYVPSSIQEILDRLLEVAENLKFKLEDIEVDGDDSNEEVSRLDDFLSDEEVSRLDDLLFDEEVEEPQTFENLFGFFDLEEEEGDDDEQEEVELDFETVISDAIKNLVPDTEVTIIGFESTEDLLEALDQMLIED